MSLNGKYNYNFPFFACYYVFIIVVIVVVVVIYTCMLLFIHLWRSENNSWESALSLHHVCPRT